MFIALFAANKFSVCARPRIFTTPHICFYTPLATCLSLHPTWTFFLSFHLENCLCDSETISHTLALLRLYALIGYSFWFDTINLG